MARQTMRRYSGCSDRILCHNQFGFSLIELNVFVSNIFTHCLVDFCLHLHILHPVYLSSGHTIQSQCLSHCLWLRLLSLQLMQLIYAHGWAERNSIISTSIRREMISIDAAVKRTWPANAKEFEWGKDECRSVCICFRNECIKCVCALLATGSVYTTHNAPNTKLLLLFYAVSSTQRLLYMRNVY